MKLSLMQVADAIGMAVLPLINQLSDFIANTFVPTVVPMIERMVASFTNLDPAVKIAIGVFIGLAAALGPVLMVVGKVVSIAGVVTKALGAITIAGSILAIKVIAVIAVIVAIAAAFKWAYDNSEPLRNAVDNLVTTFKNIFNIVKNSVLGAFQSMNDTTGKSTSFFTTLGQYLQTIFTVAVEYVTNAVKGVAGAFQVAMKIFEVAFTILQMGAGIIRGVLLAAFDILMNKLGPVSTALRAVADGVKSGFSTVASFISGAFNNVGKSVETFINFAIDAVNVLIRAFNFMAGFLPNVSRVTEIAEFRFASLSGAVTEVATGADLAATAVDGWSTSAGRANQATQNAAVVNNVAANSLKGIATAATGAGGATQTAAEKAKEAAAKFKANFTAVHEHLTGIVDDIKSKMAEMATSVSSSLMRGFNFGDAAEEFGEDGARIGGTFMEKLQAQADKVTGFAAKIKELMALGLGINSPLMQAVIAEGAGSGTAIAQSLIDSGAEGINQATGILTAAQGAADEIGTLAATNFYGAGLASAEETVKAFVDRFGVEGKGRKRLMTLMNNLADAMRRDVEITVTTINRVVTENVGSGGRVVVGATGGIVNRPTFALIGEAGPEAVIPLDRTRGNSPLPMTGGARAAGGTTTINLTVNAGMGADGTQVGEQIVSALRQYQRRNGALPLTVAS
jgi:hypothetical protein